MRPIWFTIGIISTGLGITGVILPGMPGTIFIIIAAIAFSKSHQGFYKKLKANPHLAKIINDFEQKKGMPKKAKIISIISIIVFSIIGSSIIRNPYLIVLYLSLSLIGIWVILRQKTSDTEDTKEVSY
jgi:uncharacterized membrane protein YbaN (DUF454 family)